MRGKRLFELDKGERVVWSGKPELASFYPILIAGVLALFAGLLSLLSFFNVFTAALFAVSIIFCASMYFLAVALRSAYTYTLTNQRVRSEFRLIISRVSEARLQSVTNVSAYQDFWGRLLNFGHVRIDTPASPLGSVFFTGIREFSKVQEEVKKLTASAK